MTQSQVQSDSLEAYFRNQSALIERELDRLLPKSSDEPKLLHEAMRYAVLGTGKRIRPVLCLAVCELLGGGEADALIFACAVELVHSYSLVHDDLPCLDNDEYRRGTLTCHKKFGEAAALLAGDSLLTLAFQVLSRLKDSAKLDRILSELSRAAGTYGMAGGQFMELVSKKDELDLTQLDAIHIRKTGQLIKVSCLAGALAAGANPEAENRILKFGEYLGFAFQIVDDILDADGYLNFMSVHEAREKAAELVGKAKHELTSFDGHLRLHQIADFILNRGGKPEPKSVGQVFSTRPRRGNLPYI